MNRKAFLPTVILAASASTLSAETLPPIACNLKALTSEQRRQLEQLGERVTSAITSSRELADGYTFRIDQTKSSLLDVAEWLSVWRKCCPFYEFQINVHAADGSMWLAVEGRAGVKEFIPLDSPLLAKKLPR